MGRGRWGHHTLALSSKRDQQGGGGAAHNCRRAADAAAPAGAAGTDRPLLHEAACERLRPRSPVEPPMSSSATVSVAATRQVVQSSPIAGH